MKIYEKIVIDISSGEVLEEESFEYEGQVAWCGGSGGGGGGGNSGKVDYPGYMKDIHENWLTGKSTGSDSFDLLDSYYKWVPGADGCSGLDYECEHYLARSSDGGDPGLDKPDNFRVNDVNYSEGSVGSLSNEEWAFGDNDGLGFDTIYMKLESGLTLRSGFEALDPDGDDEAEYSATVSSIHADYTSTVDISPSYSITGLLSAGIGNSPYAGRSAYNPDSRISAMDSAVSDFESRIENLSTSDAVEQQTAQFDAAMRDINAVNTSNFVIGRAIIASGFIEAKLEAKNNLVGLRIETNRIATTAKAEQVDLDRKIDYKDALWDLQIYQLGGNIMASIGGGTVGGEEEESPSAMKSAIGGALSGAAAGASIGQKAAKGTSYEGQGSAYGAGIGAALGFAASYYS